MALGAALVATVVAGGTGTLQFIVQNETLKGVPMSCDQICQNASLVCDNSLQVAVDYDRWVTTAFRLLDTVVGSDRVNYCDDFLTYGKYEYGLPYIERTKLEPQDEDYDKTGGDEYLTHCWTMANNYPPPYLTTTTSTYPPCHYVPKNSGTLQRLCPCHSESPPPPPPVPPFLPDAAPAPPPPPPPQIPVPFAGWPSITQPYSADFVVRPVGSAARSCDAICHERQMRCDEDRQWHIREVTGSTQNTEYYFSLAGVTCDSWTVVANPPVSESGMLTTATGTPYVKVFADGTVKCYTQKAGWPCAAEPSDPNNRRLCACNPPISPSPPAPPWLPPPPPSPPSPPPNAITHDDSVMLGVFGLVAGLFAVPCAILCCCFVYGDQITDYTGIGW